MIAVQISEVTNTDSPPATAENSNRPVYQLDRSEEDWSGLCRQINGRGELWDPVKCIGLGRPFWYVSFAAELRGSYEVYRDYNWGSGPQDRNGYYLNRLISQRGLSPWSVGAYLCGTPEGTGMHLLHIRIVFVVSSPAN